MAKDKPAEKPFEPGIAAVSIPAAIEPATIAATSAAVDEHNPALPAVPEAAPAVAVEIVTAKAAPTDVATEDATEFLVLNYIEFDTDGGVTVGYEPGALVRDIPKRSHAWLKRDGHIVKYDPENEHHRDLHKRWEARRPKPKKGGK